MSLRIPKEKDYWRLVAACEDNDVEDVRTLCKEASMDLSRRYGYAEETVLHMAAMSGHTAVVLVLIREGADIEAEDKWLRTPLYHAAYINHVSVLRVLLEAGANVQTADILGMSPLDLCDSANYPEVVALLRAKLDSLSRH